MRRKISVTPPVNLSPIEVGLFEPYRSYNNPVLKTKFLKGPFVTCSGLVCGRKGLIKECYHYVVTEEVDERLNEASHYYHAANDDEKNLITLDDDETYLLIHHTWHNNYYHWMCETILRLWMVKSESEKMILLLPQQNHLSNFVMPSLEPFTFKAIFHIPAGKSVLVRNLCMPQLKPIMASYIPQALIDLNKIYTHHVNAIKKINVNVGDSVYISRKKSRRRKITNEEEVIAVLLTYDFAVVYNEDYSFFEQVSLYANARYLVSIHGAGLVNMLFMPANSNVFELHKRQTNDTDQHSLIFWYMADGLKHKYYQQICEPVDINEDFFKADMVVHIELLQQNLNLMFPKDNKSPT